MVEIISHRGYWKNTNQQNTLASFSQSFQSGFGVETDIRDYNGMLVISHDIPKKENKLIRLDHFFELYKQSDCEVPLALNIKSDGLSLPLKEQLTKYEIQNYFVFDMSVPDMLNYLKCSLNCYTRQSEIEITPALYNDSMGVWLDEFYSDWITEDLIIKHIQNKKRVCIVSPELHGRSYAEEWKKYKSIFQRNFSLDITICTDYPAKARKFFE
ncbi:hypothetical protein N9W24_01090 [Gammaproteobacteria bacterium]|nr:hypothetical protein [Gammaproteobacteria bacterium]